MEDRELYATILGLREPWSVERVQVDARSNRVDVWLALERDEVGCPRCEKVMPIHDHRLRSWRHLDTCQFETRLHARVPRTDCSEHGVKQVRVPWAEEGSRFTSLFERLAIDWLREASLSAVARRLALTWDEAFGIQRRAVRRGLARRGPVELVYASVDEKSFRRGHRYVTVVSDIIDPRVVYVAEDRGIESLAQFWREELTDAAREEVTAVAMDMWEPYVQATRAELPDGGKKIVFDRFHIAKHLNDAVDRVRRAEHRELLRNGDRRLSHTRYWWLRAGAPAAVHWASFRALRDSNLKVARAWALKETIADLWLYRSKTWARRFFSRWYAWASRSRLRPMIEKARMIKSRIENVLTYIDHPITTGVSESLNSRIQAVKALARGYRNMENFKIAIYFHCGALDLHPH